MESKTKAIILAAGQGTRMCSSLHKLLHPMLGKTVIRYVVEAALAAGILFEDVTVVISPGRDDVKAELLRYWPGINFGIQDKPLGTGHAALAGVGNIKDSDNVIILYGDMPLITGDVIRELMASAGAHGCDGVVTAFYAPHMKDFGRVYAGEGDIFHKIVEARDLKPGDPNTDWVNPGVYLFKGDALRQGLNSMTNDNSQGEYYLTDVPKILKDAGKCVRVFKTKKDETIFTGINTQSQLAQAVRFMQNRINTSHMNNGVRMVDPTSVYIDSTVEIGRDVVIYPSVIIEGNCKINSGAVIGASTHIKSTAAGENSK